MNRSSKGFGLVGVVAAVILLILAALFSATAKSDTPSLSDLDINTAKVDLFDK